MSHGPARNGRPSNDTTVTIATEVAGSSTTPSSNTALDAGSTSTGFTYVVRPKRNGRQRRKAPPGPVDPAVEAQQQLQFRRDLVLKRKAELEADKACTAWLDAIFPVRTSGEGDAVTSEQQQPSLQPKSRWRESLTLGLGSVKDRREVQVQLAFLLLLCERLAIGTSRAYDPIWTEEDRNLLRSFNIEPLLDNQQGHYALEQNILVFLPHCARALHENLFRANWSPLGWSRLLLCSNRLDHYTSKDPSASTCIDRALDYLFVHDLPTISSGRLENSLQNLAVHTFEGLAKPIPETSSDFWTVPLDRDGPLQDDPELL